MIVKNLNFGENAKNKVFKGIEKLTNAVSSTLGASGKCVILEDEQDFAKNLLKKIGDVRFSVTTIWTEVGGPGVGCAVAMVIWM